SILCFCGPLLSVRHNIVFKSEMDNTFEEIDENRVVPLVAVFSYAFPLSEVQSVRGSLLEI
ncbi:hypothetical protein ACJX0J_032101, partial [Zea mays]